MRRRVRCATTDARRARIFVISRCHEPDRSFVAPACWLESSLSKAVNRSNSVHSSSDISTSFKSARITAKLCDVFALNLLHLGKENVNSAKNDLGQVPPEDAERNAKWRGPLILDRRQRRRARPIGRETDIVLNRSAVGEREVIGRDVPQRSARSAVTHAFASSAFSLDASGNAGSRMRAA
jgi:hypothetical protein